MISEQYMKPFHILTTIGLHAHFNGETINNALNSNLDNEKVAQIHVLSESPVDVLRECIPALNNTRVCIISVAQRPSFNDLFDYSNSLMNHGEVVISLMNADVSFESDQDIEFSLSLLDACRLHGHNAVLCISRRDKQGDGFGLSLRDNVGLPNFVSCDCWIFQPPLKSTGTDAFYLGQMNCDLYLNFYLTESGHVLINPCLDISVLHHEQECKNLDYYEEQNEKELSQTMLIWQYLKCCIVPFKSYGVVWARQEWIKLGYMPAPIIIEKSRIYLLVTGSLNREFERHVLFLVEIIARCSQVDILVLGEQVNKISGELVGRIGLLSRNTYFVQVDSIDDIVSNLIAGTQGRESLALIRKLSLLTPQLLSEFHSVILDIRFCKDDDLVTAPSGYSDLKDVAKYRHGLDEGIHFRIEEQNVNRDFCTLITSLYNSDPYIEGFKHNITNLHGYSNHVHIILFTQLSKLEKQNLMTWHTMHCNLVLGWFNKDPGLYECWNIGIRLALTEYVSNANVDDLRHPAHVETLLECLRLRPDVDVAATAIIAFEKYTCHLEEINGSQPWYVDEAGKFEMNQLAKLKQDDHGNWALEPHNIPHCMPVWRKDLHVNYGYFDEKRFGTFADWAFWLKITKSGRKGFLDARPLAYYFINVTSHNRRGDKLKTFHEAVEQEFVDSFYFREKVGINAAQIVSGPNSEPPITNEDCNPARKLYLTGLTQSFGKHRNSFNRVIIESLLPLHNEQGGIQFIPFIERYFVWGDDDGEAASINPMPIQKPWIGILHVPFDAPQWFESTVSPENIFLTKLWQSSLPYCRGIICLTEDLRLDLGYWYPDLASIAIKHPTELHVKKFNWVEYEANPRIIQVGDWLRRLQFIYEISAPGYEKIMLMKDCTAEFLRREIEAIGDYRNDSVKVLYYVSNQEYDELLSSSVVVLWLYGTAANNIVLECLARSVPLLVNPLPGVIEYLGNDYPLYVNSLEDVSRLLADRDKIRDGYDYLLANEQLRSVLTYENYYESLAKSDFYARL